MRRKRQAAVPLDAVDSLPSPPPDVTLSLALRALPEQLRLPLMLQYAEGDSHS